LAKQTRDQTSLTRASILDAAYNLFLQKGYAGSSIREIATKAGVTIGGVYNHFGSKDALWTEVFMEKHPWKEIAPLLADAEGDTIEELIFELADRMVQGLGKRPDFLNLMFIELVEFQARDLPRLMEIIFPIALPLIGKVFQNPGNLREIKPPVLLRSFLGFFFSFYMTEQLMQAVPSEFYKKGDLHSFVDIYLHGILTSSESERTDVWSKPD
jgi:AcrR family transcriptional regulator